MYPPIITPEERVERFNSEVAVGAEKLKALSASLGVQHG